MKNTTNIFLLMMCIIGFTSSCSKSAGTATATATISGHILRGTSGIDSVILDDKNYKLTYKGITCPYTAITYGVNGYTLEFTYSGIAGSALLVYGSPIITFQPNPPNTIFASSQYTGQ